jgi:hypothetical protein
MEYWIDAGNRLVEVDQEWSAFAIENGAPELASAAILGRAISSFLSGETTIEIWTQFLNRARTGEKVVVRIRCDAPGRRRLLELTVVSEGDRVRVSSRVVSEEPRAPVPLLETRRPQGYAILVCCSWCNRWRSPSGQWLEVEALVSELRLFKEEPLPRISHGICERCLAAY